MLGDADRYGMAIRSHLREPTVLIDHNLWKGRHPMADEAATPVLDLLVTMTEAAVEASEQTSVTPPCEYPASRPR